jgi:hypothetical protein
VLFIDHGINYNPVIITVLRACKDDRKQMLSYTIGISLIWKSLPGKEVDSVDETLV